MNNKNPDKLKDKIDNHVEEVNSHLKGRKLSTSLLSNMELIDSLFDRVDILIKREFQNNLNEKLKFCAYCTDGLVDSNILNDYILKPLMIAENISYNEKTFSFIKDKILQVNEISETTDLKKIVESVTYGDTLLFLDGFDKCIIIGSKSFPQRGIAEPDGEKVILGPKEGFTESLMTNLSMVRKRLRTHNLKMEFSSLGEQSATGICICYLDNIVNKDILNVIKNRINSIDMDAVLDSNYIIEQISEPSILCFSTSGTTERPDIVAAKILEGRVAIFVDGTPIVITAPFLFIENFQSNEDYYINSFYATFTRILRAVGFLLSIIIPGMYVAIEAFHPKIMPTSLLIHIAKERVNVPLPASVECFAMLMCFYILQEAGLRMPSQIGQAFSIVGALILGQAAVSANLVTSPMIIIVALTGITGLLVPKLSAPSLLLRFFFLFMGSNVGLYAIIISFSIFITHLFNLRTYGIPSLLSPKKLCTQTIKDTFIRSPWNKMLTRYSPFTKNITRAVNKRKEKSSL